MLLRIVTNIAAEKPIHDSQIEENISVVAPIDRTWNVSACNAYIRCHIQVRCHLEN